MNGQVYKGADLQTTAAGMRAAIAAVVAVVVGTAAATDPFFEATGRFKTPAGIETDCELQTPPASPSCPYTEVSKPIVCSPRASYCREYGRLPDTLPSVCQVNFWLHSFLECWGPYGALTPLVVHGCVPNVAIEMDRLTTLLDDANTTFVSYTAANAPVAAAAYQQCATPTDDAANYPDADLVDLRDTALAALRLNQTIGILGKLAANISHVQSTTAAIRSRTFFTSVRFRCGGENNTLMWRPNPAVPTLPADETHIAELDTLALCATVARYELTQHLDIRESPASDLDEIGCFLTDAKDYVPYYRNRTAATAAPSANDRRRLLSRDGDGPGAGFRACRPT